MGIKTFFAKLNILRECREYNLGLWQCPSFIFLIIGAINAATAISAYLVTKRYTEPEIVALIVAAVTALIFIIGHTVVQGFDKLAQASKMKTEFVSVVSHQLRTPLSAMRWTLNLLTEGRLNGFNHDQLNYIHLLKESNERMIKLVNDLLDVSRIEMGKTIFQSRQTNLYILIQKIINNFSPFAQAHHVSLSLEAPETLPNVWTDPEKISLVIYNLIDNAIKYIRGQGEVRVWARERKKFVEVAIQDTGVGVPEAQKKYIFQKFFRSDNIMKHQTTGTGLGLFIAKSVVEESGGKIWFESKERKGTTFFFTLPIYK